jgi:hypothetical protein
VVDTELIFSIVTYQNSSSVRVLSVSNFRILWIHNFTKEVVTAIKFNYYNNCNIDCAGRNKNNHGKYMVFWTQLVYRYWEGRFKNFQANRIILRWLPSLDQAIQCPYPPRPQRVCLLISRYRLQWQHRWQHVSQQGGLGEERCHCTQLLQVPHGQEYYGSDFQVSTPCLIDLNSQVSKFT